VNCDWDVDGDVDSVRAPLIAQSVTIFKQKFAPKNMLKNEELG